MVQVLMHGSDPTSREAAKSAKSPSWGVHGLRVLRGFAWGYSAHSSTCQKSL